MNHAIESDDTNEMAVAIVGMAGRYPGAPNVGAFWRNIHAGIESVSFFSDEELRARGVSPEALADPDYVKAGVLLDGMDRFDAGFFGYSAREAEYLDPQQRFFLEVAVEALEHAGYYGERQSRRIGIYGGASTNQYAWRNLLPAGVLGGKGEEASLQTLLNGNEKDALCTRVAYELDLQGPAVTVQTACSTSLVAVHMACQALLNHEADMALAGGVSLNLGQGLGYRYQAGSIASPDGHCRAFDARAAGTISGSGVGIVVLKRLADALADGDTIYALIKGSAINNDGSAKVGYTAPSVEGQAQVILAAQTIADVAPDSISYVEAHGTGTPMGDPIEIAALTQAFRDGDGESTVRSGWCAVGSVKTNIGHLDAAAGVTGLIKAVLALHHKTLPPSLHYEQPNPQIDFAASPFYVNTEVKDWAAGRTPRRAGVSSFGMGGTNAHVVLEEAPALVPSGAGRDWQVLPVSARSAEAAQTAQAQLARHLSEHDAQPLSAVAYTLQTGRRHFAHRRVVLASTLGEAAHQLASPDAAHAWSGQGPGEAPEVAFLFPGQGAQHAHMGQMLYESEPVFREMIDHCCELLQPTLGLDLRQYLFPTEAEETTASEQLAQTAITQPALFVVEYATARLWLHWGLRPALMLGHSVGEYVAACIAGVFDLRDALDLIAARGRLMQALPRGAMLAVELPEAELQPWLSAHRSLAAVNAERMCVLSGTPEAIDAAERELMARGTETRRLQVSHAFHSAMVDPALPAFEALVTAVTKRTPAIPFISNVTGRTITDEEATSADYWVRHLRGTVRFAEGLGVLLATPGRLLLEVGPGEVLTALVRRHANASLATAILTSQPRPPQWRQGDAQCARALAQLWVAGAPVDWQAYHACHTGHGGTARRHVPLPTYPFESRSYWIEPGQPAFGGSAKAEPARRELADWFQAPIWRRAPALARMAQAADGMESGFSLVFGDAGGLRDALVQSLALPSRSVVVVESAAAFEAVDAHHYRVRTDAREDLARVLREAGAELGPLRQVFHLWSLEEQDPHGPLALVLARGLHSLLALVQALYAEGMANQAESLRLTVVASQLEDVTGLESLNPGKALLHGPCKVLPHEFPNIACQLIDVVLPTGDGATSARLAEQVLAESQVADPAELVAYRGPHRWLQAFEPVSGAAAQSVQRLKQRGVYLITGGLGGIGLALAGRLAHKWQARLVLVGRSEVPARHLWGEIIADPSTVPALRERLQKLTQLAQAGAELLVLQADVADAPRMREVVRQAVEKFGGLHGVVHAAGLPGGGVMAQRERTAVEAVCAPKVQGTRALMAALEGQAPDFVLLCSSTAAALGAFGDADYCAANCYLDATARLALREQCFPVWSVNWDTWREVGMAAHRAHPEGMGISTEMGALAFEHLLAGTVLPQLFVSPLGLSEKRARLNSLDFDVETVPTAAPVAGGRHDRPALATPFVPPEDGLEADIAQLWTEALGFSVIGVNDSLFELGGDSLTAIQLLGRVRKQFGVTLHPAALFNEPTVAALAVLVELRLIEQIEQEAAKEASGDEAMEKVA
ncbi:Acyl transferase domain-containing protein [Rhodoferax sp. OV413]|uniref:type I polyketide synthase n=1 Tax=Rhodoferax sp. OV413 TaxID=1855285 RepID=UPI00088913A1|nr:type I polyketide synthase [Rhodoferax sp. OV413]SDO97764.1 Acyl transferase domain-containing protein [Rhodoferax sp. OV413]